MSQTAVVYVTNGFCLSEINKHDVKSLSLNTANKHYVKKGCCPLQTNTMSRKAVAHCKRTLCQERLLPTANKHYVKKGCCPLQTNIVMNKVCYLLPTNEQALSRILSVTHLNRQCHEQNLLPTANKLCHEQRLLTTTKKHRYDQRLLTIVQNISMNVC